jgi:hypothetical protein
MDVIPEGNLASPVDPLPGGPALSPGEHRPLDAEAAEEVDLWWGGFTSRAMGPDFVLCGILTAILFVAGWLFRDAPWIEEGRSIAMAVAILLWLGQIGRWIYRTTSTNYRLTTRRLLLDRGFYQPIRREIELARVAQIVVVRNALERLTGVGRIKILIQEDREPPLFVDGDPAPDNIAMRIREQVQKIRVGDKK